jgi:hypothetical protein
LPFIAIYSMLQSIIVFIRIQLGCIFCLSLLQLIRSGLVFVVWRLGFESWGVKDL